MTSHASQQSLTLSQKSTSQACKYLCRLDSKIQFLVVTLIAVFLTNSTLILADKNPPLLLIKQSQVCVHCSHECEMELENISMLCMKIFHWQSVTIVSGCPGSPLRGTSSAQDHDLSLRWSNKALIKLNICWCIAFKLSSRSYNWH